MTNTNNTTFEELEMMSVNQLKGIATSLGVDVKPRTPKAALVKLVYDLQQPEDLEEEAEEISEPEEREPEAPKAKGDVIASIEQGLESLIDMGLKWSINGGVILFEQGDRRISTNINQPEHRIVRTAETFCRKG